VAARMRYTGYVCTQSQPRYAGRVRAEHAGSDGERAFVLATAGGGADGHPMMCIVLDALEIVRATRPCAAVLIAGPFMPSKDRRDLERRAKGTRTKVRPAVSDSLSYMHAADAVVLMAGYNSSIEVLRAGTPSILVPRVGPSAEQRTRARLFAERGWARVADREGLTPELLASALLETLDPAPPEDGADVHDPPPLGGLDVAVGHLLALLDDDEEPLDTSAAAVAL
jgi:predicted glycosyltransferase